MVIFNLSIQFPLQRSSISKDRVNMKEYFSLLKRRKEQQNARKNILVQISKNPLSTLAPFGW